jgi:branched-chain amino acid transport system ATP-binding protein
MLEVRDLHAGYGRVPVLRGVSLSVPPNHIVGLLGANGA